MKKLIWAIVLIACSTSVFFAQRNEWNQFMVTLEKEYAPVLYVCSAQCHGTVYRTSAQCPKCKKPLIPTTRKG